MRNSQSDSFTRSSSDALAEMPILSLPLLRVFSFYILLFSPSSHVYISFFCRHLSIHFYCLTLIKSEQKRCGNVICAKEKDAKEADESKKKKANTRYTFVPKKTAMKWIKMNRYSCAQLICILYTHFVLIWILTHTHTRSHKKCLKNVSLLYCFVYLIAERCVIETIYGVLMTDQLDMMR